MSWKATLAVFATCLLLGCKAPTPEFNPFAGYGSPRVPPPATGAYGRPDAYYPGGQTAPAAVPQGTTSIGPLNSQVVGSGVALASAETGPQWRPAGVVQPAMHTAPVSPNAPGVNYATQPAAFSVPGGSTSLNLSGMHVNDATQMTSANAPPASNQRIIQFNQAPTQSPYGQQQYAPPQYVQPQYAQPQYLQPGYATPQTPVYMGGQPVGTAVPATPGLLPLTNGAQPLAPTNSGASVGTPWQPRYTSES
ncbi:hypothetical protein [Lignipirellula cremea]|uniref:Uncharacterized protein n=1 Tax=Lignipirellula cremea TaxID=2528010 RepID=A0A518DT71_9BACT|nr:hypothetical protein [Lignipirellula cremea]QDU95042.1 hypothetical protein Pla8534_28530 [Lignipirellula cremea]